MKNIRFFLLFIVAFFCTSLSFSQPPFKPVKNTIIMIADGWSINHIMAANFYEGKTEQIYQSSFFDFSAYMSTYLAGGSYNSASAWGNSVYVTSGFTDSAAAGTALATGEKTYDGSVNMATNKVTQLKTSSQWAQEKGRSTGVVSSAAFSDATPATFGGAHNTSRSNHNAIARDMLFNTKLTVILSPGNPDYDHYGNLAPGVSTGDSIGGRDLWTDIKLKGYSLTSFGGQTVKDIDGDGTVDPWTVIHTKADFLKVANGQLLPKRLLGIADVRFVLQPVQMYGARNTFANTVNTVPTLADMSSAALNVLNQNCKGFYVMIEGASIDKASHSNDGRDMIREMGDFNRAVERVIQWVEANSSWDETLLVVTGDHETGYLTGKGGPIGGDMLIGDKGKGNDPEYMFSSTQHTNQLVPIFAKGVNAERFADYCTKNDIIGQIVKRGLYMDNTDLSKVVNAGLLADPEPVSFRFARQSEPASSTNWHLEPYVIRIVEGTSSIDLQYGDLLHTSKYKISSAHTPNQIVNLPITGKIASGVGAKSFTLENLAALPTGATTFTMELLSDCYTDVKNFTVKVMPKNVMWTGTNSDSWFDDSKWKAVTTAGGTTIDASKTAYFPLTASNVTIQGKVDIPASNAITDDGVSANAECNEIHFTQDASMGNVQRLSYKKAFLDYKFEKNRWQLFSVPLRNMYSGDFYFDFRPKTHYRILNVVSPEKNPNYNDNEIVINIGEWTKPFSNLSVPFNPESSGWLSGALGVFITDEYFTTPYGDSSNGIIVGNTMALKYPRSDESNKIMNYYWIDPVTLNPDVVPAEISSRFTPIRNGDDAYRFIFEDGTGKARSNLKIAQGTAGNYALVGNPFMGHLNFNTLYSLTTAIDNEYKIFNGTSYITWKNGDSSEGLNAMIAPLQGFIVPLIGSGDVTVSINPLANNLVGVGTGTLKSSSQNSNRLRISATQGTSTSSILIKGTDSGNDEYDPREDAEKLFFDSGFQLDLFSVSDSKALEINVLNNESINNATCKIIPLGLRTTSNEDVTFHIEGVESFDRDEIYLIDKYEGKEILLNVADSYLFSNPLSENMVDVNRFELRFGSPPTGIDDITENQIRIWVGTDKNQIIVRSAFDDPIQMIFVYDLNGNIIKKIEQPESNHCNFTLDTTNQIVLLKAVTRKAVKTRKITLL